MCLKVRNDSTCYLVEFGGMREGAPARTVVSCRRTFFRRLWVAYQQVDFRLGLDLSSQICLSNPARESIEESQDPIHSGAG